LERQWLNQAKRKSPTGGKLNIVRGARSRVEIFPKATFAKDAGGMYVDGFAIQDYC
jgi:hypothetical protein